MNKLLLATVMAVFPCVLNADIRGGMNYSIFDSEQIEPSIGYRATMKIKDFRAFADYTSPRQTIFGQSMGEIETICAGAGLLHAFNSRFSIFGEVGYCFIDNSAPEVQKHEVVTAKFQSDFTAQPWWPFGDPLKFDQTRYWLDDNAYRFGVGAVYEFTEHWSAEFSLNYMSVGQHWMAWIGDKPSDPLTCKCLVLENEQLIVNSARVTLMVRF